MDTGANRHGTPGPGRAALRTWAGPFRRSLAVGTAVALVALAGGCDWAVARSDAGNSGYSGVEDTITAANVGTLTAAWSTPGAGAGTLVEANGSVITPTGAFSTSTGARQWTAGTSTPLPYTGNGFVYGGHSMTRYGITTTYLDGLNPSTGAINWSAGAFDATWPFVLQGTSIYAMEDGASTGNPDFVARFSATSGGQSWSREVGLSASGPAAGPSTVYVWADDDLVALNSSDGSQVFSVPVARGCGGGPVVANGFVYLYGYAYDASSGAEKFALPSCTATLGQPAVSPSSVFQVAKDAHGSVNLVAANATSGAQQWSIAIGGSGGSPAVADGVVYIESGDHVLALDASSGALLWTSPTVTGAGDPIIANGTVYDASASGTLYAFCLPPA